VAARVLSARDGAVLADFEMAGRLGRERPLVLGTSPYDERITCLADLTEIGALPRGAFDAVVLAATVYSGPAEVVVANVLRSLRPGGLIVASTPHRALKSFRASFDPVAIHRRGLWMIVDARRD
jgi:SAM-dependent methyltransferase